MGLVSVVPTSTEQTYVPFQEFTIPGLRAGQYQSQLAALEPLAQSANYSSYLTSYQSDGLRINALLTKPQGEMPVGGWPAVVFIHGYIPPTQYRTQERYLAYVDYLARHGLVVFKIDLRGHGASEGEANGAYYAADYVVDTLNARAALQVADFVNPDQIGLWGHSMAGNVVLRAVAVDPTIRAAVIWAGAVFSYEDWQKHGLSDGSYRPPSVFSNRQSRRQALFATHGQFDPQSSFWQQVPATNYLDGYSGAIQLHHAANDSVVSVEYSRELGERLQDLAIEHEYHEYVTGGHNLDGASFGTAMQRTVNWFKEHL